jgi:signal transduction histidine kinase
MISTVAALQGSPAKRHTPVLTTVVRHVLRTPLVLKVMGANAIIAAVVLLLLGNGLRTTEKGAVLVVLGAIAIAFVVNLLLVRLALSPVAELERVAARVSGGQYAVRAQPSLVADSQLSHLADTVNGLLDSLAAERRRIQKLGAEVISTQDIERARIARELHDSIAQTLAAVRFQLSAASADATDDEMRNRLSAARGMIGKAMDEVRQMSQSLHPRMAEDLGLVTALEALADQAEERGRLKVRVATNIGDQPIPASVAATLFRVAQESLKAAETRTSASSADILLYTNDGSICLEVKDNRRSVDNRTLQPDNSTSGLSSIMDRVELSGGVMRIESGREGGVRVTAELASTEKAS